MIVSFFLFVNTPAVVLAEVSFGVNPTTGVQPGDTVSLSLSNCGALSSPAGYIYRVDFAYQLNNGPSTVIENDAIAVGDRVTIHNFPIPNGGYGTYKFSATCKGGPNPIISDGTFYTSLVVKENPTPDAPKVLGIVANADEKDINIFVTWNKIPGTDSYRIAYKQNHEARYTFVDVPSNLSEANLKDYVPTPLAPNTLYAVFMQACRGGFCSAQSETKQIETGDLITISPTPSILPTATPTPLPAQAPCTSKKGEVINGRYVERCASIKTDFGEIPTDPAKFVTKLFSIILGFAGGLAVLLILYAGYRLIMSQGDPEKIKGARETITSAIVGLLFIIFSFVIYQIVAGDILRLPSAISP